MSGRSGLIATATAARYPPGAAAESSGAPSSFCSTLPLTVWTDGISDRSRPRDCSVARLLSSPAMPPASASNGEASAAPPLVPFPRKDTHHADRLLPCGIVRKEVGVLRVVA